MADNQRICPADGVQVNETKVRIVAGFVVIAALLHLFTGWLIVPLLLLIDFGFRSVDLGMYSPFGGVANWFAKSLKLPYKPTDQAPKRFAARLGLAFSILITALQLAGISTLLPTSVLSVFAALESIAGFCAGCHVYTYYTRVFPRVS